MKNTVSTNNHSVLKEIFQSRGMVGLKKDVPLWKLKITDEEYKGIQYTLANHAYELDNYSVEAALCYAEWWRRDYNGNIPSKEDVAHSIGLGREYAERLYRAARKALEDHGYTFIHSLKGTEFFRTLLNQGGLPVNYIKNNNGNLGTFSRFLSGLVKELYLINYDWNEEDFSFIQQLGCISYLGKAFRNDNIYDVAMQIAHAIMKDDNDLLPYDDTDESLAQLTASLKSSYNRVKNERHIRPLSLHWKLITSEDGQGYLFVNMDVVKDISSDSIPGLDYSTCYSFDVFVAGVLVGKYVRKSLNKDEEGNVVNATYTRISIGVNKDILWKGEPVVEVKVRCDNDDRIFLTIAGCYPPNFEYPQVFQMLDDNIYCKSETANAEKNIAVFSSDWKNSDSKSIKIAGQELCMNDFTQSLDFANTSTGEFLSITNQFTPYRVEFSDNYITWVEKSNYKLLTKWPVIRVYDKEKNKVNNSDISIKYRIRNGVDSCWKSWNSSCMLPCGIVDIAVSFPDGHSTTETFYAVRNLNFESRNEEALSAEIICSCDDSLRPEIEKTENIEATKRSTVSWKIERSRNSTICPSTIGFRLYNQNNPTLCVSVAIPFDGVMITDVYGNIVPNSKVISYDDLAKYCIVSHGNKRRYVDVSYTSDEFEGVSKHLKSSVIDGVVSLSDYSDLVMRMFNLYGENNFNRTSSVVLNVSGKEICIRKFVLESTIIDGKIEISDPTEYDTTGFVYDGDIYCFPVDDNLSVTDFKSVMLERVSENDNLFTFPENFNHNEVVVFSGIESGRRIVPKYYNREGEDFDKEERSKRSTQITKDWSDSLVVEDVMTGMHWGKVCRAYDICSHYNLPFNTFNGLKAVARDPKLVAKFVIAMWLYENTDVLTKDIDRFEQEMAIALHWLPQKNLEECISEFMQKVPEPLLSMMYKKMQSFVELLQNLFDTTVSTAISNELAAYYISGEIGKGCRFAIADMNTYKTKVHGLSSKNLDLPLVRHQLKARYYPAEESMLVSYRVMFESAMCAAENTSAVTDCINLFSKEGKEHARVVNFYRKYFKETYSDIFLKTLKFIVNPSNRI